MNTNPKLTNVIFNSIDNGIIIIDLDLIVHGWNKWLEIFTKTSAATIEKRNLCEFYPYINKKKLQRRIKTVLITNNSTFYTTKQNAFLIDIPYHRITNSKFSSMQQEVTIVPYDPEKNQVCMFIYDKTALSDTNAKLSQLNLELQELSHKDSLTGLFNRRFFAEEAIRTISSALRKKTPLSIIMMDIDNFKTINDTYGHKNGDTVIITLAKKLKSMIRKTDVAARFGGEEFVLLLPETTVTNAYNVAENIRKEIESYVILSDGKSIQFTISFGVTLYDPVRDDTNIENTLARADTGLYQAKNNGRNRVVLVN